MINIDGNSDMEIDSDRYFIKENKLLKLLPNLEENEIYADNLLSEINKNFVFSMKENQFYDNFNDNLKLLQRYIKNYSLRFTKLEYVSIIKLLFGVLIQKDIDIVVTLNVISELKSLLKKAKCLSRQDLTVDWRPLYDIWYYHNHSSKAKNGIICYPKSIKDPLVEVIRLFSCFFSTECTEEVWLLARPYLHYPYPLLPNKHNGLKILKLLLPFYYNNRASFFELIWPQLLQLMSIATWTSKCEHDVMILVGRAASTYVGLIDWTPALLDQLFTSLLRSLKIKVAGCHKKSKFTNSKVYVDILIYTIYNRQQQPQEEDGDCDTIRRFRQLFQAINHLFHPSSHNSHTGKLLNLIYQISAAMLTRFQDERVKKPNDGSFGNYSKDFHMTDSHVRNMVNIMLPSCEFAIFTKEKSEFGAVLSSVQKLSCLCPELMVPACLKLFHETSETVLEPHRALSTLAVVSMLHVPLLNSVDRYPEGKLAVFPLMRQLITYININDPPKSYISIICFGNLANILSIEDLSDKANDKDLSPFEKEVALATAQFEDLVLQFFDKLFEIIDIGFSESEMVESQRNSDFKTEMLIDALVMIIPNLSNVITLQVLDKTIDFAFNHSFLTEPIQQFFAAIFGCLLEREAVEEEGVRKFMPQYMRYFHGLIRDDCMIIHEQMDFKFVWLTNLLPGFIKMQRLPYIIEDIMEILLEFFRIHTFDSLKIMNLLLTHLFNQCTRHNASLDIVSEFKDRNFHLNSWSGIITKRELCDSSRYKMKYAYPGEVEKNIVQRLISEIISPTLKRLIELTAIIKNNKEEKIGNKELRSLCNLLLTVGECHIDFLIPKHQIAKRFQFDSTYGPITVLSTAPPPPVILPGNILSFNNSKNSISQDIKAATRDALSVIYTSIESQSNLSRFLIPSTDIESLFHLVQRSHDPKNGARFSGQINTFLDRRFDSFIHPLRPINNTMLNWVMMIDDWNEKRFKHLSEPLTEEIASLADSLFLFLGLPHPTLQKSAINSLNKLISGYSRLDEYLIHKCFLIVTDKLSKLDEHLHCGISQLLLKIFDFQESFESVTSVYKFISIFVALGRSPHVDVRNNRNLHSKMFDLIIQLMGSFKISSKDDISYDFSTEISNLSSTISDHTKRRTNIEIFEERKKLYYSCLEFCLSSYLDNSSPNEKPLLASKNLSSSLSSTTTWQSIYQMSIIVPLHIDLPIPLSFLELFFLIIFSPSKELSSQGCNQINIIVWLLKQTAEKIHKTPRELGLSELPPSSSVTPGPRPENSFLVIEKDTDYWSLPIAARMSDSSNGYLWWPQKIKIRHYQEKEKVSDGHHLKDSNLDCWKLLCRMFESEEFCNNLESFLLDLGSQFLREEETCQPGSFNVNSLHQFSVDHLINSMFICIGPRKALPPVKKIYERLVRCTDSNQVYANRMAVQILSGVLMSSKYWTFLDCSSFFSSDLLIYIDLFLENCSKSEVKLISKCLVDLSVNNLIDSRQLIPVYRHFLHLLDNLKHDSNKEAVCLHFARCFAKSCGWRIGSSIIEDMIDLWRKFVASPVEKLRKETSEIMRLLTFLPRFSNQYFFCSENQKILFQKFPTELIQMFANQTQLILSQKGLEPSVVTMAALRIISPSATETDMSDVESVDSSIQTISAMVTPLDTPPNELENGVIIDPVGLPDKVVSSMISSLTSIVTDLDEFVSHDMLKMFFICFDLIPVRDKMHIYSHLRYCALMVANIFLFDEPSTTQNNDRITCSTLFSFIENAIQHKSWRVRLISLKMLQVISFNNFFIVSQSPNMSRLLTMAFQLIIDQQIEVRKESGVMLSGLIQCHMFHTSPSFISDMLQRFTVTRRSPSLSKSTITSEQMLQMHSGVLALCSFIQAHPFDIPSDLPEVLTVLCRYINQPEPICSTIKDTLAKFKKSHQDSWHLESRHFTEDQLSALTDVLVSPSYYA